MRRTLLRVAALAGAIAAAVAGLPGVAAAHAGLESSTPAANSVLEFTPPEIRLDFDEDIEVSLADISLYDSSRREIEVGSPQPGADGTVVIVSVPALDDGLYAVVWRVTSADGHVVDGAFSFQVGTAPVGSGADLVADLRAGIGGGSGVAWAYGIARFLSMLGAMLLIGGGWWALQRPAPAIDRRAVRAVLWGAGIAMVAGSLLAFAWFAADVRGGGVGDLLSADAWGDAAGTDTGRMLLLRSTMAAVLVLLLALRRHQRTGWWVGAADAAAVLAIVSFGASGHPNSLAPRLLWIVVDVVHFAAATAWLGGLAVLALVGTAARREPEGERLAGRFSVVAAIAVAAMVLTGVAQGLKMAGGVSDLTATDWGTLLLAKMTLVVVLLAVAGVSRWLLRREGAAPLGRTLLAEAVLAVAVVGLAAGMVAQPPRAAAASAPYTGTLAANGVLAAVTISPGWVGNNEVHILVTPPGGSLTPVAGMTARVSLPADGIPASPVTLTNEGPNHYSGTVAFSRSGDWTLELIVQITATDTALLKATVSIP